MTAGARPGVLRRISDWFARRRPLWRRHAASAPAETKRAPSLAAPSIDLEAPRRAKPRAKPGAKPGAKPHAKLRAKDGRAAPAAKAERPARPAPAPAPIETAPAVSPPTSAPPRAKTRPRKPAAQRRAPVRSATVTVEDLRIHAAVREGKSSETALILIHGAGLDHRDWTFRFLSGLPADWRVIAFDRPGFGQSDRGRGAAAALPATQARLLAGAARALGVKRAVIVGHSWGGAVAMAWALDAPEMVRGVASLAGAVTPWSLSTVIANGRRLQAAARTAMGAGGMRAAALDALADSFQPQTPPQGYADHVATELDPLSGPAAATMADISTINGALALMTPRYGALHAPVALVYGEADTILSIDEQASVAAMLPNATLTRLPGIGHMVHHCAPKSCYKALAELWIATV